ncbi:MAG: HAD-IIIA family hydrolase [Microcoleaceae cyanobacterium]
MMNQVLLFDCDWTIRRPKSNSRYIKTPDDQEPIPGAMEAIEDYYDNGWDIIGITNQTGVASGQKSFDDCIAEQQYTLNLFSQINVIYLCTDYEGKECYCVTKKNYMNVIFEVSGINYLKPNAKMIIIALIDYEADLKHSCMVGNSPEDEQIAAAAGIDFMWADVWREQSQTW